MTLPLHPPVIRSMVRDARSMVRDDRGQGLVEYALIIALIAIVCASVLSIFGSNNNHGLKNSANQVPG